MQFNVLCEFCGNSFQVPNQYVGKHVNCVHCKATVVATPIVETTPLRTTKSTPKKSNKTLNKKFFPYSLEIETKPPFLYKFFSWLSLCALIGYFIYFYEWNFVYTSEQRNVLQLNGASILDNLWYVIALFGTAQLIRFIHSIAWNLQEIRKSNTPEETSIAMEMGVHAAAAETNDQLAEGSLTDF